MKRIVMKLLAALLAVSLTTSCRTFFGNRPDPELAQRLNALATYTYGADRAPVTALADYLTAHGEPADRVRIEHQLTAFLATAQGTHAARQQLVRELGRVGSDASAPALVALLDDPALSDDAAMALERISTPAILTTVRAALPGASPPAKLRLITVLGRRGDRAAVNTIAACFADAKPALATVVADALGGIADAPAARALLQALPGLTGHARAAASQALLRCRANALEVGDTATAEAVTHALAAAGLPAYVEAAAAAQTGPAPADMPRVVRAMLTAADPAHRMQGVRLARNELDAAALATLAEALPSMDVTVQLGLLGVLEDRAVTDAASSVAALAGSSEAAVRLAALRTLRSVGTGDSVELLAQAAAGEEPERAVARKSLRLLAGLGVDARVQALARTGNTACRVELIDAIADRKMEAAAADLFAMAGETNAPVREASIRALGAVSGPDDWDLLLKLIESANDDGTRQAAVSAAAVAGKRIPDAGAPLVERLASVSAPDARVALLTLAGRLANDATLPAVAGAVSDGSPDVRNAALRALGAWKTTAALPALMKAASNDDEQARHLAQRGALDLIRGSAGLDDAARVGLYRELAPKLERADELRILLSAVGNLGAPVAFALAAEFIGYADVRGEAEAAAVAIAKRMKARDASVTSVLKRIADESKSEAMRKEANGLLGS